MNNKYLQWIIVGLLGAIITVGGIKLEKKQSQQSLPKQQQFIPLPKETPPVVAQTPKISNVLPDYLDYSKIIAQLKQWNQEAQDLTEINTYGKSNKGNELYYIQITNKLKKEPKPVVLIHACIHGNEPLATSCIMGYIGNLLNGYNKDQTITKLIDSRNIYFIPVLSPDSYPNSRFVDGVDPNRDYPNPLQPNRQSSTQVKAVQDLFLKIKPKAVLSGHTFGRVYLYPYGYQYEQCPHANEYKRILQQMGKTSNYKIKRACEIYNSPIYGGELDWYYLNGAFSIVCEFGTHQRIPTKQDIKIEYDATWTGFLYFIQEAPLVEISNKK